MKTQAAALDGRSGVLRYGIVASYNPAIGAVKVTLQPENILSGWLPVAALWAGSGWGVAAPPPVGTQVLVLCQEGDAEQGVVIGALWSAVDVAVPAPLGELWLVHQTGSFVKLTNDGNIYLQAKTVNVAGDLVVSGDVFDQGGQHGSVRGLRTAYDGHVHGLPGGGQTATSSEIV
ncbi:phage baseplate assembly protein V [Acidocella sp.]|uniref:phage baseplate assembly protein V n=1 Tax=Acidocella sp. TaxID=50710 RepID=UPI00261484C3|nr:phage baseplate assembly protein V [Acidocella sp.]